MPIELAHNQPVLLIRRAAFEQRGLRRALFDEKLGLTADEFRVEADLIVIGPIPADAELGDLIAELESSGLVYFDDFFDMSGNWPDWLKVFAMAARQ